jgi:hypothetical protein
VTITPIDTCGLIRLGGERYQRYRAVRDCPTPMVQALMENYRTWADHFDPAVGINPEARSSVLFDTVPCTWPSRSRCSS